MSAFLGLKPACSLIRFSSSMGAILLRMSHSYNLYVLHKRNIGL